VVLGNADGDPTLPQVKAYVRSLRAEYAATQRDSLRVRGRLHALHEKANLHDRLERGDDKSGNAWRNTPTTASHKGIYVTNELILRPALQSALAMTYAKLQGRTKHLTSTKRVPPVLTLMHSDEYRVVFAYLVSRQILIARINNPRTTYKKVVDYRRVIAQENSAMIRMVRLLGFDRRRDTLFGYGAATPCLF